MPKAPKAKPEKGGRKKKDPNAPKRPLAPYMFFCKENRERVKSDNPDVSFGELGKLLGASWAALEEKEKKDLNPSILAIKTGLDEDFPVVVGDGLVCARVLSRLDHKPYLKMAEADKKRYADEVEAYGGDE